MEEPYRIDRMLFQLKLSGLLDEVNGVILGASENVLRKNLKSHSP